MKPIATTAALKSTTLDYLLLPRLRGFPLPQPPTTTSEIPSTQPTPTTVEDIPETTTNIPITSTMITEPEDDPEIDSFEETEEPELVSIPSSTSYSSSTVPSARTTTKTTTSTTKKLSPNINLKGNYFNRYFSSYQKSRQTWYFNSFSMRFSGNQWLWFRNWCTVLRPLYIELYQISDHEYKLENPSNPNTHTRSLPYPTATLLKLSWPI